MKTNLRTHTCGELTGKDTGTNVTIAGWVNSIRGHGKVTFVDVRDRYGFTQVVLDESKSDIVKTLHPEAVVQATGKVAMRPAELIRKDMPTGEIEIQADTFRILNNCEKLPLDVNGTVQSNEETRLKYRYLDLRNPVRQNYLAVRHKATKVTMDYFDKEGFLNVTTPLLMKPTPEGARDYVVPSRVNAGQFYALPQSPQLYKQILMCAGIDRYFQMAICLRDEDLRADRQPEFTQIDFEMSFVAKEDVFRVTEGLVKEIWKKTIGVNIKTPFKRLSHKDALGRFGSDKPDLRFALELSDITSLFAKTAFGVFKSVIDAEGAIKALYVPGGAKHYSKNEIRAFEDIAKKYHAKGLVSLEMTAAGIEGNAVKFFSNDEKKAIADKFKLKESDLVFVVADKVNTAATALGQIRLKVGADMKLIDESKWEFVWILDFPLFEWNDDTKKFDPAHHPFCSPYDEHMKYFDTNQLEKIYCNQYDLALNGVELLSGSIRINRPDVQEKVFKAIGITPEEANKKFGFLLDAFKYGAPPHGGAALGFDRVVAMMCGLRDIREVIAFPKNKNAQCPMDGSPTEISEEQQKELHLMVKK